MNKNELHVIENHEPVETRVVEYVPSIVQTVEQAAENLKQMYALAKKVMRYKVDYDTIPGTPKPTLLKPGAERLLQFFGLGHKVQCINKIEDWEKGFFFYHYKVSIIHPNYPGFIIAECEGSANSREKKYRSQDPYTIVNTLQKMAIKRALVGATLQATGASGLFTQDVEDLELEPEQPQPENNVVQYTKPRQYQNPRGAFFAECANRKLTEKQQKAIVYAFTGKESRRDLTDEEYQALTDWLKEATNEDIKQKIKEGATKKEQQSQPKVVDPETGEVVEEVSLTKDDLDEISEEGKNNA